MNDIQRVAAVARQVALAGVPLFLLSFATIGAIDITMWAEPSWGIDRIILFGDFEARFIAIGLMGIIGIPIFYAALAYGFAFDQWEGD